VVELSLVINCPSDPRSLRANAAGIVSINVIPSVADSNAIQSVTLGTTLAARKYVHSVATVMHNHCNRDGAGGRNRRARA
jgi:hypothetical protein